MTISFYRALLVQDDGDLPSSGYGVVFPDFPGCTSEGDTQIKAATHATEALNGHVATMIEEGVDLPEPSEFGAGLPDWLDGSGAVVGEVLVPCELPGRSVRANITVDEALLQKIDHVAEERGGTRSGFLAEAAREWFRRDQARWIKERARDLQAQLDLLRSGKMRTHENRGGDEVDTSASSIARIESWLAELDDIALL